MKTYPRQKFCRKLAPIALTVLLLITSLYCGAAAESSPSVPSPSTDFYYTDQAGILSDATKALILTKNAELSPHSIQLVVYTENSLPVSGYTARVEYLRTVMESWQVGGPEKRGLLLALSLSDNDYIAVAGEGLQSYFTTEFIKSMLDAYLEPDFAAGSYDAGVSAFVTGAAEQAKAFAASQPASAKPEEKPEGLPAILWVAIAAGAVAVLCIAFFVLSGQVSRRRYAARRGVHRHAPLVTPPRTNVMRHENHTPMLIKSAHRGDGPSRVRKL